MAEAEARSSSSFHILSSCQHNHQDLQLLTLTHLAPTLLDLGQEDRIADCTFRPHPTLPRACARVGLELCTLHPVIFPSPLQAYTCPSTHQNYNTEYYAHHNTTTAAITPLQQHDNCLTLASDGIATSTWC